MTGLPHRLYFQHFHPGGLHPNDAGGLGHVFFGETRSFLLHRHNCRPRVWVELAQKPRLSLS